jgi:Cu2+-containing amine oxidase
MYRYTIDDGDYGGCVLASSEDEGEAKVRAAYLKDAEFIKLNGSDFEITVWQDEEISSDVVQVYP